MGPRTGPIYSLQANGLQFRRTLSAFKEAATQGVGRAVLHRLTTLAVVAFSWMRSSPEENNWMQMSYWGGGNVETPLTIREIGTSLVVQWLSICLPMQGTTALIPSQDKIPHLSFSSVHSVVSDSHGLQHARPPCPSPSPGVYPNSCPSSWRCHPTISSSW